MELNIFKLPDHNSPEFITYLKRLHKKGKDILADPKLQKLILSMSDENLVSLFCNNWVLFNISKKFEIKMSFLDTLLDRCLQNDLFVRFPTLYNALYLIFRTNISNTKYRFLVQNIKDKSCKNFLQKYNFDTINDDVNYGYYIIELQNTKTGLSFFLSVRVCDSNVDIYNELERKGLVKSIINGTYRIKSFIKDELKSKLIITDKTFKNAQGTYLVECKVNDNFYKFRVTLNDFSEKGFSYCDLTENLIYGVHIKNVDIVNITFLKSENISGVRPDALYKIQFIEDSGKTITKYIKSDENGLLDLDTLITKNNFVSSKVYQMNSIKTQDLIEKIQEKVKDNLQPSQNVFSDKKYGGSQIRVRELIISRLLDQFSAENNLSDTDKRHADNIINIVKKYFPNVTSNDIKNIAYTFEENGCGYICYSNMLCNYFDNLKNGENIFQQIFGFKLYLLDENGNKSYNLECLAVELFLKYHTNILHIDNVNELISLAVGLLTDTEEIKRLLNFYSINIKMNMFYTDNLTSELLSDIVMNSNMNEYFSLFVGGFDLCQLDNNAKINSADYLKGIPFHGMVLTEIDDEYNLVVSSWSRKYKVVSTSKTKYYIVTNSFSQIQLDTTLCDELVDAFLHKKEVDSIIVILNKISSITKYNLPNGFLSVEHFKYYIVEELIKNNCLDTDPNNIGLLLSFDIYIIHCLISMPQIAIYLSHNINKPPYTKFKKLNYEDLEIVLSDDNMLDLIYNQMTDAEFLELLENYKSHTNLLVAKTFRDRLFKVDSNKLQEFMIDNYNLIKDTIRLIPSEERKDFYYRIHNLEKTKMVK